MSRPAIWVDDLWKEYVIGARERRAETFQEMLIRRASAPFRRLQELGGRSSQSERIWALQAVSLEVAPGEVVGIIGRNGAGKTTLLKVLSRITPPTKGKCRIVGRLASLLEVGTGFHPELTGRENIFLNGAILGMKRAEIESKFDEIVQFSGIEKFLDTPVKRYSSGMYVRLAFAVAAHLEPDILLVDEVLAVGDAEFQRRCLGKIREVASTGRTVLFVSHNMSAISRLCGRTLLLSGGEVVADGPTTEVMEKYLTAGRHSTSRWESAGAKADQPLSLHSVKVLDQAGREVEAIPFREGFSIRVQYRTDLQDNYFVIAMRILDMLGNAVLTSWDNDENNDRVTRPGGDYSSTCRVPGSLLRPGRYVLRVLAQQLAHGQGAKIDEAEVSVEVTPVGFPLNLSRIGLITPILEWSTQRIDGSSQKNAR